MKNRIVAGLLTLSMILGAAAIPAVNTYAAEKDMVSLVKSNAGNPVLGFDDRGDLLYGGDPSALVDGDTVYIYVLNSSDCPHTYDFCRETINAIKARMENVDEAGNSTYSTVQLNKELSRVCSLSELVSFVHPYL